jgi:hypothetical protein
MIELQWKDLTHPKLSDALEYLGKLPLDFKLSWNVARLTRQVSVEQGRYKGLVGDLLIKHVRCEDNIPQFKKDEKGEVMDGNWDFITEKEFSEEYIKLLTTPVYIQSYPLTEESMKNVRIPAELMHPLIPFCIETMATQDDTACSPETKEEKEQVIQ